jgi:hypothetical protein
MRCPSDLKKAFLDTAKEQDRDGAQLIREFMRSYIVEHAQKGIFSVSPVKAAKRPKGKP